MLRSIFRRIYGQGRGDERDRVDLTEDFRVRARPEEYLRVFESLFLGTRFDARSHSHLYLPSFLSLVADVAPDRVRSAASRLLQHYDTAMSVADDAIERALPLEALPEDTSRMVQRLDTRRRELRALLR